MGKAAFPFLEKGLLYQLNASLKISGLMSDQAEEMQGVGVIRVDRQDLAIKRSCLRQAPRPVVSGRRLQQFGDRPFVAPGAPHIAIGVFERAGEANAVE